jgi:hypothetical protein
MLEAPEDSMATRPKRMHENRDRSADVPESGVFEAAGDRRVARRGSTLRVDDGARALRRGSTWSDLEETG